MQPDVGAVVLPPWTVVAQDRARPADQGPPCHLLGHAALVDGGGVEMVAVSVLMPLMSKKRATIRVASA